MLKKLNNILNYIVIVALGAAGAFITYMFVFTDPNDRFPEKESLVNTIGTIESFSQQEHRIKIKLENDIITYGYESKGRGFSQVMDALNAREREEITLLVKHQKSSNIFNEDGYKSIYQISFGENVIRTYEDIKEAHRQDNILIPFIGLFFLCGSVLLYRKVVIRKEPFNIFYPH
jgi:hypothetical protein